MWCEMCVCGDVWVGVEWVGWVVPCRVLKTRTQPEEWLGKKRNEQYVICSLILQDHPNLVR